MNIIRWFAARRFNVIDGLTFSFAAIAYQDQNYFAWAVVLILGIIAGLLIERV